MAPTFANWSRTVASSPTQWHTPSDEAELVDVVRRVADGA